MKKTALFSVYDKTGIVEFAQKISNMEYDIISSGGTAKALRDAGIQCRDVSEYTGAPEILGGRVKTLQYPIYGGILASRDNDNHMQELAAQNIQTIDIVVCNLYPFEKVSGEIPKPGNKKIDAKIIENIDIGGPTMLRAAAKNHKDVLVITDPADYDAVLAGLESGGISDEFRLALAAKVYSHTAYYDSLISNYLNYEKFPSIKTIPMKKIEDAELRYGENPHQQAALYANAIDVNPTAAMNAAQLQGKKLSYNNYLDLDAAWKFMSEFTQTYPMCTIMKHNNTCGAAADRTLVNAFRKSYACDPLSAFGGIVAFNQPVDVKTAREMIEEYELFVECIIAPGYTKKAMDIFSSKKNIRIMEQPYPPIVPIDVAYKTIEGGILVQDKNTQLYKEFETVTERNTTLAEDGALDFAWRACKMTKSNAIILARGWQIVGVGTGQQSRIDSLEIAIYRMNKMACNTTQPLVMASDAFFPFPDCIERFAKIGGRAVIWPGGSTNDQASIDAANAAKIAMVKTSMRHFAH